MRFTKAVLAASLASCLLHLAAAAEPADASSPLRVCADPGNMPLSNKKGEGFQNKVAEILAKGMGVPLEYYWYPYYGRGLARSTINAEHCDVLMDLPSDYEMALVTKPYYRSTFVLVYRKDENHKVDSLDDPILKKWRIGVLQSSPAREVLHEHDVIENTEVQYVFFDSSYNPQDHPGKQIEEVLSDKLNAAETWGPIGGYYAVKNPGKLDVLPLNRFKTDIPLEFSMSFGVRRADTDLRKRLDDAFVANKAKIEAVLRSYGVPLVKCDDCVISGDLPSHGPYTSLEAKRIAAGKDAPVSSAPEFAAMKKRLADGADASSELSDAVVGNDPARVKYLLEHGADPNKIVQLDYNALLWAVREGHVAIAEILLDHGAKAEQRDSDGWSPLMFAVWRDKPDMIALLIKKGAAVDAYGSGGWNPLTVAITYGTLANVKQVVDAGANVNAANEVGYTPLMFASAKSGKGVIDYLVAHGANVRSANKGGVTSLMIAAAENDAVAIKSLLPGSDPGAKDAKGQTALDIATSKGNAAASAALKP